MAKLTMWEKALLFQYVIEKGLPPWAKGSSVTTFARLMNITEKQAEAAFYRAHKWGYLDKT